MRRNGFRWEYVAIAAVLTLAVLSFAYYSYESVGIKRPMEKALLSDPDVSSVSLGDENGVRVVQITIRNVPDLSVTYARLLGVVKDHAGSEAFKVQVKDQRDAQLEGAYHSIHFYLEEASARGNFGAMIESCSRILGQAGITGYKITVDEQHIFVQMAAGQGYLYQVLDRSPGAQGGATQ